MCEQSKMLDQNIKTVDHSTCPIQSRLLVSAVVRLHPAGQWLKDVYHQLQQQHQISTPPTVTARAPRTQGNMINIAAIATTAMTTSIPDLGHTPGSATRSASAAVHGIRRSLCGKALTGVFISSHFAATSFAAGWTISKHNNWSNERWWMMKAYYPTANIHLT